MICPICRKTININDEKYIVHIDDSTSVVCHEKCVEDMVIDKFNDYGEELEEQDYWAEYNANEER